MKNILWKVIFLEEYVMSSFEYENLIVNTKAREHFFRAYDRLIALLKRHNYFEAARLHLKNRKRISEELALFD